MGVSAAEQVALRDEVRSFIRQQRELGTFTPRCDGWSSGFDADFSRRLGDRGWLGMTIPREYGGHGRTFLERFIVNEELLAAGAPMAAHWIADRQIGPQILRYGTEEQRRRFLPRIAAGEVFVAVGMSEPDSGSDLASLRTRADRVAGGWRINGTKVWSSHAHRSHLMVALVRTGERGEDRHQGLSQVLIDLSSEGIEVRPISVMAGGTHFAEVFFTDVFVPDEMVLGAIGAGWAQVNSELAYERSGPERFLSPYPLLHAVLEEAESPSADTELGGLLAELWALRILSEEVNRAIEDGAPELARPALIKNAGTLLEREMVEVARRLSADGAKLSEESVEMMRHVMLSQPSFTLRGGTNEVLRTIVARAWTV